MNEIEYEININLTCHGLEVLQKGILSLVPFHRNFDFQYEGHKIQIAVDQGTNHDSQRMIRLSVNDSITIKKLWACFHHVDKLLMVLEGYFYEIETISFQGDTDTGSEYTGISQELLKRRLPCYKTDSAYRYKDHSFVDLERGFTKEMLSSWITLERELDIVHQIVLYSTANTGITRDVKCAYLIECFEPITEIVNAYDFFFPSLRPGDRNTTLKMCIDAVISKYGKDVFEKEYACNKERFLQTLVNSRNRIMHIKRNQPAGKYLSGTESVLYAVKLMHLYRIVLLSLMGVHYDDYSRAVVESIKEWNQWQGVLDSFLQSMN